MSFMKPSQNVSNLRTDLSGTLGGAFARWSVQCVDGASQGEADFLYISGVGGSKLALVFNEGGSLPLGPLYSATPGDRQQIMGIGGSFSAAEVAQAVVDQINAFTASTKIEAKRDGSVVSIYATEKGSATCASYNIDESATGAQTVTQLIVGSAASVVGYGPSQGYMTRSPAGEEL